MLFSFQENICTVCVNFVHDWKVILHFEKMIL
jgi:hypothetical protein